MHRRAAFIGALAVLALAAFGCHHGQHAADFPPGAMVLRMAQADDIPTLDPAAGYDTLSWSIEQMIFDTLVRYGDDNVELVPDLATSWESSPDARTFTFHLRHDARFSSGRAVTSADFRYAIERVLDPSTRSKGVQYYRSIEGADRFAAGRAKFVSGIETPDPYTIIFHLVSPDPIFIHKLAMPFASAVLREVAAKWGPDFSDHVVGSGPFVLKQWARGERIVLARNPYYFVKGLPRLDGIVELLGVNENLQWLKFDAGEIDLSSIPPAEFPYVMKTPALSALTLHIVEAATYYAGMNCQMPPFNDLRVRQAFNYAIDKRKIVALLNGRAVIANGVLPPGLPGFSPRLTGYPYEPAKARALLEKANLGRDFSPVLWIGADQTEMMIGQSIQQDLDLVGVHVQLKPVAFPPFLEAIRQPDTVAFFITGWEADFPDPENFLDVLLSKKQWGANNDTFYYDPRVDALLDEAAPLADLQQRYLLYHQAEQIVVADAPWVFLYHPVAYDIQQPWVHGLVLNPMRPARFEKVWLTPHTGAR